MFEIRLKSDLTSGVGCTKGEQRSPPDGDFLKLSKYVQ